MSFSDKDIKQLQNDLAADERAVNRQFNVIRRIIVLERIAHFISLIWGAMALMALGGITALFYSAEVGEGSLIGLLSSTIVTLLFFWLAIDIYSSHLTLNSRASKIVASIIPGTLIVIAVLCGAAALSFIAMASQQHNLSGLTFIWSIVVISFVGVCTFRAYISSLYRIKPTFNS